MVVGTRASARKEKEGRPQPCRRTRDETTDTDTDTEDREASKNATPFSIYEGTRKHGKRARSAMSTPGINAPSIEATRKIDVTWFDKARLRVIAAAVYGFRCILTLEPGLTNKDLNFVHFLAKTTSLLLLFCFEYAWGLYPGHLNVNFYLNIDIMRTDLHHSFDAGVFFFLPAVLVLQEILEFTEFNASVTRTRDKKKFYEEFKDATWTYSLFGALFDPDRSIHRRNVDTSTRIPDITRHPNKEGYVEHQYPFNHSDMQNIVSHVHPFFVVANTFLQLKKLSPAERKKLVSENDAIRLIWKIGELWTRSPPVSFKDTKMGGANAMGNFEKDKVSFLADRDSHAEVKYQKKDVFYRRLLDWADEQRSVPNLFSREATPGLEQDAETVVVPETEGLGSRARSKEGVDEDIEMEDVTPAAASRPSKRKRLTTEDKEKPVKKRKNAADQARPPRPAPRRSSRGRVAEEAVSVERAIESYPSSIEVEVVDGTDFFLDFVTSQIRELRRANGLSIEPDDDQTSNIALKALEIPMEPMEPMDDDDIPLAEIVKRSASGLSTSMVTPKAKTNRDNAQARGQSIPPPFGSSTRGVQPVAATGVETPAMVSTPKRNTKARAKSVAPPSSSTRKLRSAVDTGSKSPLAKSPSKKKAPVRAKSVPPPSSSARKLPSIVEKVTSTRATSVLPRKLLPVVEIVRPRALTKAPLAIFDEELPMPKSSASKAKSKRSMAGLEIEVSSVEAKGKAAWKTGRLARAASTPPMEAPRLTTLRAMSKKSKILLDGAVDAQKSALTRIKPSSSKQEILTSPRPEAPSPAPTIVNQGPADESKFIEAGRNALFQKLSTELGIELAVVSKVYGEIKHLETTERVLRAMGPSGGRNPASSRGPLSMFEDDVSPSKPRSIVAAPPTAKQSVARAQSIGPPSRSRLKVPPTPQPSVSARTFLRAPSSSKKKVISRSSSAYLQYKSSDEDLADDSEDEANETRTNEMRRRKEKGKGKLWENRKSWEIQEVSSRSSKRQEGRISKGFAFENRLDSLTRSIELILRN